MGVPEAEIGEHEELNKSLWRTNAEITLKNSIFEFFYQLYHTKNIDELSILSQKVKETFIAIIWCLQIMSLLWIPNLPISNWSKNMTMWEIIGYLRLDNICSEFEIITEFFFLTIIMAFIIFLCITAMTLLYYNSHNIPKFILTIFKSVFDIWAIAFLIPSITLFSAFLKYNLLSQDISAYESNNDQDEFKLSSISQLIIIFIMILIFPLIIVNQEFSGLIRHSISSRVLKAKAHSKIDVHIAIFTYFSPILYVCTGKDYMVYFQLFMMIISLILIWEIANFSPYFSFYYGLLKILELFAIALISFGFILGHLMDNSLVIIFIAVILGPFSALFVIQFTLNLQSKFNVDIPENLLEIYSKYELEKSLRHSLCSNDFEHKDQIINIFETFFNDTGFDRDKLQLVWVANYCLFTLKDESLAKIKLSRTKYISKWNLEADFQIYCTNKVIQGSVTSENEQYIIYLQQFHLIKNKDLKLCVNLLKFWDELTSSRPDLNRLKKRLALINKNIVFIAEKYSQLSTKFCNSREALSLYTSFMRDVLFDNEKSRFLENKLRFLSISIGNSGLNPFSFFDDTNSILIVSAEKESFGRILFTNAQAKNIMKLTSLNFDRGNIMNFIHSYYWRQLKEFAIRYSHFCSNSEINLKEGFFLNLPSEFLIGCIGKVSVTAIGNFIVFVLVFKQSPKNYQIALLSENGEILCHTKDFAERAGKKPDNLVGCNIKHLFPNIEQYSINNDFAKSESSLYYSIAYFQNLKIYYALLISDYNEIQTSKNEDIKYTLDIKGKKDIKSHSSLNLLEWFDKEFKKESQIELSYNSEMHLNSQNFNKIPGKFEMNYIENFEEEKSEVLRNNRFTKLVLSSSKKINMLHFAFILSILSVLGTNIAVLFYAFYSIEFIRKMDLPIALGNVDSKLQHVSLTARMMWSLSHYGGPDTAYALYIAYLYFPSHLDILKNLYLNITSSLVDWNYCSGQSIFIDDNIKLWSSSAERKINLLDLISKSIQSGSDFIKKYNNSENYKNEITFLALNNFGEVTRYCNNSLYQVIDCQKSMMLDFKTEVYILLILGVGVLALCICAMVPFCYSTINYEDELWNNLRKKAYENYSELKQNLLERIKRVHCQPEILVNHRKPSNNKANFKSYYKYVWRISIYFIAVTAFSIANIAFLYEKCTDYLSYRPDIMKEMINRQILQNSIMTWTTLSQFETLGIPLVDEFVNLYPYMNSSSEFQKVLSLIEQSKVNLRNPKYLPILSDSFKNVFYKKDSYYIDYFNYGTSPGEELLLRESYFYAYSNLFPDLWIDWLIDFSILNTRYGELANEIDQHSQSVIEAQVNAIVATFVFFAASSIAIYFLLYFAFFKKEKECLGRISSIMKLMPNKN